MDSEINLPDPSIVEAGKDQDPPKGTIQLAERKLARFITAVHPQVLQPDPIEQQPAEELSEAERVIRAFMRMGEPKRPKRITPKLTYYIAGSFAAGLLSQATQITDLEGITVPEDNPPSVTPSEETIEKLGDCVRPIGDCDYVPLGEQLTLTDNEGNDLRYSNLPEDTKPAIKKGTQDKNRIILDGSVERKTHRISRIKVDEQDYYIERPDAQLGGKILYILQNSNITLQNIAGTDYNVRLIENVNFDFPHMLEALLTMYGREHLVQTAYQMIRESEQLSQEYSAGQREPYSSRLSENFTNVLANPHYSPVIKTFFTDVQQSDAQQGNLLRL